MLRQSQLAREFNGEMVWAEQSATFRLRASADIFAMMGCVTEVKHFSYNGPLRKSREVRL